MVKLWSGAYFPNERWADNREYYRQILSDYKSSPSLRKMAAGRLFASRTIFTGKTAYPAGWASRWHLCFPESYLGRAGEMVLLQ